MNHLSAVGLIFDIVGVVILAWAVIRATVQQIRAQVATAWSFNPDQARALIDQRADALAGLPCLVLGFHHAAIRDYRMAGPS